jgi:hypothetical protein
MRRVYFRFSGFCRSVKPLKLDREKKLPKKYFSPPQRPFCLQPLSRYCSFPDGGTRVCGNLTVFRKYSPGIMACILKSVHYKSSQVNVKFPAGG